MASINRLVVFRSKENDRWYWKELAANNKATSRVSRPQGYKWMKTAIKYAKKSDPLLPIVIEYRK